ncbi:MAG: ATP-binding protein [Bacteroidota bacterium]
MKQVLVIAFLFLTISCFAQSLVIHTIPREGVQLDTGWKFHAGDNTEWAKPEFDDRAWATIDPLLDVHHSLPQIPRSGISWLRIHLAFDSALLKRHLSLVIEQSIREKLKEVSELSEKNIQQEQEKQQILAAQNEVLETQVSHRTTELRESLENLKNTQAQLIQSEKMASLGELTAGIAHEIQNPLNFVNNFSEVTTELLGEMKAELVSGNTGEAIAIANDLEQNLQKINHHGKRADSIVKGMLQHSKQTSGLKEATDINALCDEYLRLSFHGFKAKDDLFNATINTDFDTSIGKTNLVPQAMGKALLNLFNNALYAVNQKGKAQINDGYQPTIKVSTRKLGDRIEISIEDNGDGIREKIADKIFQPFFTTKPAGQGTGLGLSLAYDIVTKEHLGQITIKKGNTNNTEFIIQIPVQNLIK